MAFIMCSVPDELKAKLDQVRRHFNELGVEASNDEVLSYLLEEGLEVIAADVEQNVRRQRFLNSFKEHHNGSTKGD